MKRHRWLKVFDPWCCANCDVFMSPTTRRYFTVRGRWTSRRPRCK